MVEKGDKSCPICTEEMDLTDQQLKPCKCGYEICVWCWHHILEMAEKDGIEGRCPACCTPYDKQRIVAMSANCERLVAEFNSERKKKMQKLKPKSADGRKLLSDVRVIQRNLVYIIGLPLDLADEDLLQHMEFFGRYGKVLKVSISRTSTGLIQHTANNSCCVYITYSKEVEAVRCIQSVHCFVLEGKLLRACFGTTKYCHAWLRNVPCSNRDCLYLHDFGSQEDSFTKDELVLAFARSRVQQIIGATINLNRRAGNVLPPPVDDHRHSYMSSTVKTIAKNPVDRPASQIRASCSSISIGNSMSLPATTSWVMCVSGNLPTVTSPSLSGCSHRGKPEVSSESKSLPSGVLRTEIPTLKERSVEVEDNSALHSDDRLEPLTILKHYNGGNWQASQSNIVDGVVLEKSPASVKSGGTSSSVAASKENGQDIAAPVASTEILLHSELLDAPNFDKDEILNAVGYLPGLCSKLSSTSIGSQLKDKYSFPESGNLYSTSNSIGSSTGQCLDQCKDAASEPSNSPFLWEDVVDDMLNIDHEQSEGHISINNLPFVPCSASLVPNLGQPSSHIWQQNKSHHQILGFDSRHTAWENEGVADLLPYNIVSSHGFNGSVNDSNRTSEYFNMTQEGGLRKHVQKKDNSGMEDKVVTDMGESSIISNILSLELDTWEESLALPHSIAKFLGQSDEQHSSLKASTLRKVQDKNQSRFSFARQDEFSDVASDLGHSFGNTRHASHSNSSVESDLMSHQSFSPSSSSAPKPQTSTPLGFSVPVRTPPGFPSHHRVDQNYYTSVKTLNHGYASSTTNFCGARDLDMMDQAISEAGKGLLAERLSNGSFDTRQTLFPALNPYEDDVRRKLLMQQYESAQNFGLPDQTGSRFSLENDFYRISPQLHQFQPNNSSLYGPISDKQFSDTHTSNSHCGGWSDVKNYNALDISDMLNSERLGFSKFISMRENIKF